MKGVDAIRELAEDWQYGDVPIEEHGTRREALNVVLSMPAGTEPIAVQKAARDFAAREFANHKYAMALHTADTPHYDADKNDPPSPHPHVHLIIQSMGMDGKRLNPRKADLARWREGFAAALQAHGVDAVATSRALRLQRQRGDTQAVRRMKEQGKAFEKTRTLGSGRTVAERRRQVPWEQRVEDAKKTEATLRRRYSEVTAILIDSDDATDRALAAELAERFGLRLPMPPDRGGPGGARRTPRPRTEYDSPPARTGTDDLER